MKIYLDNAATTQPCERAIKAFAEASWYNSESFYDEGLNAQNELNKARKEISELLFAKSNQLIFTSGGTEANNLAIFSALYRASLSRGSKKLKIFINPADHSSIINASAYWAELFGIEVVKLEIDQFANPIFENVDLENAAMICLSHVNNETGAVLKLEILEEALAGIKGRRPLVLVDGVQGFGKGSELNLKRVISLVDFYSISAHKLHSYKGSGALYTANPLAIRPIIVGGDNHGKRGGTENLSGIVSFAEGAKFCADKSRVYYKKFVEFKESFLAEILGWNGSGIPNMIINSAEDAAPNIISISFAGVKSEALVHLLDSKGVLISAGAACSNKPGSVSHVAEAIKIPKEYINGTVRLSLGCMEIPDACKVARIIAESVEEIRKYSGWKG